MLTRARVIGTSANYHNQAALKTRPGAISSCAVKKIYRPLLMVHINELFFLVPFKYLPMESDNYNIDDETISKLQLRPSDKPINANIAGNARVFEYPGLENVFVMESDLYGNVMPQGSCFLAFYGRHGLIGQHLHIETLKNASVEDIKKIVESNSEA